MRINWSQQSAPRYRCLTDREFDLIRRWTDNAFETLIWGQVVDAVHIEDHPYLRQPDPSHL